MPPSISIEPADASDRNRIYALRHEVYAVELGQHAVRPERELSDALDLRNRYLVWRVSMGRSRGSSASRRRVRSIRSTGI